MNKIKMIQIGAIAAIMLGIIHLAATPVVMNMTHFNDRDTKITFLYMFLGTGIALVFPGIIMVILKKELNNKTEIAFTLVRISALVILLLGVGAVIGMCNNPFAYVSLIIGLYVFLLALSIKTNY